MKPSEALAANRTAIHRAVAAHHARNPRVIGSVLHGEDAESSDLDLLVDPTPEATLFDLAGMQQELEALLGVPVDVVTPNALPDRTRERILAEAEPV